MIHNPLAYDHQLLFIKYAKLRTVPWDSFGFRTSPGPNGCAWTDVGVLIILSWNSPWMQRIPPGLLLCEPIIFGSDHGTGPDIPTGRF